MLTQSPGLVMGLCIMPLMNKVGLICPSLERVTPKPCHLVRVGRGKGGAGGEVAEGREMT